jgi:hypothetical protein
LSRYTINIEVRGDSKMFDHYSLWTSSFKSKEEFQFFLNSHEFHDRYQNETDISKDNINKKIWHIDGFCQCCNERKRFLLDWKYSNDSRVNFRERLLCEKCKLNSRQRFVVGHLKKILPKNDSSIYLYEQVTPLFKQVRRYFGKKNVIGSEYLGFDKKPGMRTRVRGIRHEDALNLSFSNESIDVVISNDVYEHIPDISKCFKEAYRVLKPGGQIIFTIPFHHNQQKTKQRAIMRDGQIIHLEPESFHENPVSKKGSLVFYDYGWDILDTLKETGFIDSSLLVFYSEHYGYLGLQLMFTAMK